jgi:hypothetical protein
MLAEDLEYEVRALLEASDWPPIRATQSNPESRSPDEIAATGEIYLELAAVDLDNTEAICDFISRFGPLGVCYERFALLRHLPRFDEDLLQELLYAWPHRWIQSHDDYLLFRGAAADATLVETLTEFRFGARVLHDLTLAWQITNDNIHPDQEPWQSLTPEVLDEERARLAESGIELTNDLLASDILLRRVLTAGLRPFHPRIIDADSTPFADNAIPL